MLIEKLNTVFTQYDNIQSAILVGSQLHDKNTKLSDIDLILYVNKDFESVLLPKNLEGKLLDIKILKDCDLSSNLFETRYHILRMISDEKNSTLLFGKRPKALNPNNFELDYHLKIISKYLSFSKDDLAQGLIDNKKTIKFGKISYRKLANLIKTYNELNYSIEEINIQSYSNSRRLL